MKTRDNCIYICVKKVKYLFYHFIYIDQWIMQRKPACLYETCALQINGVFVQNQSMYEISFR